MRFSTSGSNNSPVRFDAHIAFPSSRLPTSCHISFSHINGFHLNTFVSQRLHPMCVCQPAWSDFLMLIRTSCRSLSARQLVDLICSLAYPCASPKSLRIDYPSICFIGRVSSCPLYTCLVVRQIVRIHRPSSSTWHQPRGTSTSRTITRCRMNGTRLDAVCYLDSITYGYVVLIN